MPSARRSSQAVADGRHLGVAEHHPRDAAVVGRDGAPEDVGGRDARLVGGDVGEGRDAGDVPDRPDPVGGAQVVVDGDGAVLDAHPGRLEAEPVDPWAAARGHEQHGGAHGRPVLEAHLDAGAVAADRHGRPGRAVADGDAVVLQRAAEVRARERLVARQRARAGLGQGDLAAEAGEHLRELDADGPRAEHDHAGGHLAQGRRLTVRPERDVGQAVDRREGGRRPGGDDDPLGPQRAVAHPHVAAAAASSRPGPRTTSIPCASSFRVFFVSSRPEFMYSRYARTSSQRGAGVDPRPGTCAASARTSTGRRRVFEGMQAQNGHSPPTSSCSTTATAIPPAARAWAV